MGRVSVDTIGNVSLKMLTKGRLYADSDHTQPLQLATTRNLGDTRVRVFIGGIIRRVIEAAGGATAAGGRVVLLRTARGFLEGIALERGAMVHEDSIMEAERPAHHTWPERRLRLCQRAVEGPKVLHVPVKEEKVDSHQKLRQVCRELRADRRRNTIRAKQ